ncbi:MAG TPA: lytic transglycosylase domain-containing protein [Acetobacteraceae bacterium]
MAPLLLLRPAAAAMTAGPLAGSGCRGAVAAAERAGGVPPGLLGAIARVESGRRDPVTGETAPWPWSADVEGTGYFYPTKAAAVAAVRQFQAQGIRSIDVGCMQVNLQQHPDAFPSLEAAFDPAANATYAARFLNELHDQTGDWSKAAGMYHSATPVLGAEYQRKVLAALPEEQRRAGAASQTAIARAWSASLGTPLGTPFGAAGGVGGFHPGVRSMTTGGGAPVGRSLASYRAMPVRMLSMPRVSFFPRR